MLSTLKRSIKLLKLPKNRLFPNSFPSLSLNSKPLAFFTTKTTPLTNTKKVEQKSTKIPKTKKNIKKKSEETDGELKKHEFKAENKELLNIVSRAIYTNKEVFLRELISNASDALEQLRYTIQKDPNKYKNYQPSNFIISISTSPSKNQLIIQDTGMGMTETQLKNNLGTIARSGSKNFLKTIKSSKMDNHSVDRIIGQFGVGFYSAFMVSNKIEVYSKSVLDNTHSNYWVSDGSGTYSLSKAKYVNIGTKIIINLKKENIEFLDSYTLEKIIKKYSNYISFPIYLNNKRLNVQGALWVESPSSITIERYNDFFKYLTNAYDPPLDILHFRTDVPISINALFYLPKHHSERYGMARMDPGVSVYSRKVLIKKNSREILPDWLRCLKGVVDSEDLPLNISRENMQNSILITKIKKFLVKRIISHFTDISRKDPKKYNSFYKEYHPFLKEGICSDIEHKDSIGKLLRFESSKSKSGEMVSLDDYLGRMNKISNHIYYLVTSNRTVAESSPYFEAFKRKGTEVLFMYTAVDEFVMQGLNRYSQRKLVSIESKNIDPIDLDDSGKLEDIHEFTLNDAQIKDLCLWMTNTLKNQIKSVSVTHRLLDSPAIIVDHESSSVRGYMKLLNQDNKFNASNANLKQKLQINKNHSVIRGLYYTMNEDVKLAKMVALQLLDQARIEAGLLDDLRSMIKRMNSLLTTAMNVDIIETELKEEQEKKKKEKLKKEN